MATIVMDMDGCDIAHETLLLKEFGEQAELARKPPQGLVAKAPAVASPQKYSGVVERARALNIDLASACNEVGDCVSLFSPSAVPKCP